MKRIRKHQGSVLLMVVGILAMIGMLGGTFLLIAHVDARQARDQALRAQAWPLAGGLVKRVQDFIRRDLPVGGAGPYSDLGTGPDAWYRYVDAPDKNTDVWLSQNATSGLKLWEYYTTPRANDRRTFGNPLLPQPMPRWTHVTDLGMQPAHPEGGFDDMPWDSAAMVDTDADSLPGWSYVTDAAGPTKVSWEARFDAVLCRSGVTNSEGTEYLVAVRVIDTSGLMNVQFAGETIGEDKSSKLLNPISPANFHFRSMFPESDRTDRPGWRAAYDGNDRTYTLRNLKVIPALAGLHPSRCGGTARSLQQLTTAVGSSVLAPSSPYRPFGVNDEILLRWYEQRHSLTKVGRLWQDCLQLINDEYNGGSGGRAWEHDRSATPSRSIRQFSTTWNSTRNRLRNATDAAPSRVPLGEIVDSQKGPEARQTLYRTIAEGFMNAKGSTESDVALKKEAAHFVANLWAYMSPANPSESFAFTPTGESFTVFGVVEQLVIVEAMAYVLSPSSASATDGGYAYAVELFNPTQRTINTADYYVNDVKLPTGGVGPGGRVLVYNYGGNYLNKPFDPANPAAGRAVIADKSFGFDRSFAVKQRMSIDFTSGDVKVTRQVGGKTIPIDYVTAADFGFSGQAPDIGQPPEDAGAMRDDHMTRQRCTVAYMTTKKDSNNKTIHRFGQSKEWTNAGVRATDFADESNPRAPEIYEGFGIGQQLAAGQWRLLCSVPTDSIGDMMNVFVVGPEEGGTDLPHVLRDYRRDPYRGRLNPRGPVALSPSEYPDVPWAALLAEYFEMLPTDTSRTPNDRQYGKININTTPVEVLQRLPWPTSIVGADYGNTDGLARYITAYRDRRVGVHRKEQPKGSLHVAWKKDYGGNPNTSREKATGISGLRRQSEQARCFLTPGEIMIPIADWWDGEKAQFKSNAWVPDYHSLKYCDVINLYGAVANLLTVNSDTFAAYVSVQLGDLPDNVWHYLVLFDRSHCRTVADEPAVLLFAEMK